MEVNRKNVVDVSSFFFFEATGDSDQADDTFNDPNVAGVDHRPDDDAESSCSCDLTDGFPLFVTGQHHHRDANGCDDSVNGCDSRPCSTVDDEEEEEGDEAHSYSRWSCYKNKKKKKKEKKKNKGVEREKKSSEFVDSSEEVLSEQEKNRLFWETCLAS